MFSRAKITLEGEFMQPSLKGLITIEEGANWLHSLDEELSARFLKWKTDKSMEGIWCNYSDFIIRLVHWFVLVAVIIDA